MYGIVFCLVNRRDIGDFDYLRTGFPFKYAMSYFGYDFLYVEIRYPLVQVKPELVAEFGIKDSLAGNPRKNITYGIFHGIDVDVPLYTVLQRRIRRA